MRATSWTVCVVGAESSAASLAGATAPRSSPVPWALRALLLRNLCSAALLGDVAAAARRGRPWPRKVRAAAAPASLASPMRVQPYASRLAGGAPQSQIICSGCGTLLFYPQVRARACCCPRGVRRSRQRSLTRELWRAAPLTGRVERAMRAGAYGCRGLACWHAARARQQRDPDVAHPVSCVQCNSITPVPPAGAAVTAARSVYCWGVCACADRLRPCCVPQARRWRSWSVEAAERC